MTHNVLSNHFQSFFESSNNPILKLDPSSSVTDLNRHSFYFKLNDFFSILFNIDNDKLTKLSGASYFYFKTIIIFDKILDNDSQNNISFNFLLQYQESVRILEKLFPENDFWDKLYSYFDILQMTYKKEKAIKFENVKNEKIFYEIAKNKSVLAYSMIDALVILGEDNIYEERLKTILNFIHLAFQIRDDIDDFKHDLDSNQITLPIYRVENYIKSNNIESNSSKRNHNILYGSGIASKLINEAIVYYKKAQLLADSLSMEELVAFLKIEINDCISQLEEIEIIRIKSIQANSKSNERLFSQVKCSKTFILKSLESSYSFFKCNIGLNGWADFITSAGISTGWAQYFVCSNLIEASETELVMKYLNTNPATLDSFNDKTISDSDTIAFKLDILIGLGYDVEQLKLEWLTYCDNGKWSTYLPDESFLEYLKISNIEQMSGWTTYHKCISSFSAYLLGKHNIYPKLLNQTLQNLFQNNKNPYLIDSYWWTSPIYSTYYTVMCLIMTNQKAKFDIEKSIEYLYSLKNNDGSWNDEFGNVSVFYTTMVIHILLTYNYDYYKTDINLGIEYLLSQQMNDGSWCTIPKLKIPSPNVTDPFLIKKWNRGSLGTNTIVDDHNRFFTTSFVYKVLKSYKNLL